MAKRLRKFLALVALGALATLIIAGYLIAGIRVSVRPDAALSEIDLPRGFRISIFADNLGGAALSTPGPNPGPRLMLLKEGVLYVTVPSQGRVVALFDADRDGRSEGWTTLIEGLRKPHGIDHDGGWFYVAEETRVIRFRTGANGSVADPATLQVLVDGLPEGGHFTRTVKVRNGSLYVSAGSSCNVCSETDPWRAAITRCNTDGTNCAPFARGLRNSVGFVFHPQTGQIYATDNGRDWLGDDAPPDEINLVEEGKNYGWPLCYGKRVHDTEYDKSPSTQPRFTGQNASVEGDSQRVRDPCADTEPSLVDLQAHSAPLGLAFYDGTMFPAAYRGNLFVAFHGSWNRGTPTGYKVVVVNLTTLQVSDFATGWLQGGAVLGRPVDVVVDVDGGLLVSDDNAGRIYRIWYRGR
ncbi:MAG: PQQ-dependent sugar dehydrogenase [Halobacteria archaeon]